MGTQFEKYHNTKTAQRLVGYKAPIAIHPGEFLEDTLEEHAMSQVDLAEHIGISKKIINDIVRGRNPVSNATALKLSKVFNLPTEYWMQLQQSYDAGIACTEESVKIEKEVKEQLLSFKNAYLELKRFGDVFISGLSWTPKNLKSITQELQKFFAVDSLAFVEGNTMQFAFRKYKRDNLNHHTLAAWLRIGTIKASKTDVLSFDEKRLRETLPKLKALSNSSPDEYLPKIEELLALCGVVVVYMPNMKNTFTQGASKWVASDKALLMLNAQKRKEGQFWFNLFHELGHILLHSKKESYIDIDEKGEKTEIEQQADNFAQKQLITNFAKSKTFFFEQQAKVGLKEALMMTAQKDGVSPDILAGRFTYEFNNNTAIYTALKPFLKTKIDYTNI